MLAVVDSKNNTGGVAQSMYTVTGMSLRTYRCHRIFTGMLQLVAIHPVYQIFPPPAPLSNQTCQRH